MEHFLTSELMNSKNKGGATQLPWGNNNEKTIFFLHRELISITFLNGGPYFNIRENLVIAFMGRTKA